MGKGLKIQKIYEDRLLDPHMLMFASYTSLSVMCFNACLLIQQRPVHQPHLRDALSMPSHKTLSSVSAEVLWRTQQLAMAITFKCSKSNLNRRHHLWQGEPAEYHNNPDVREELN